MAAPPRGAEQAGRRVPAGGAAAAGTALAGPTGILLCDLRGRTAGRLFPPATRLRAALRELAGQVRRNLGHDGWSLHRLPPFDGIDLAPFDAILKHESGWAALAGGLHIRIQGGRPQSDVWATGAWNEKEHLVEVHGLDAKLALAHAWGVKRVFVPESQARVGPPGLTVEPLLGGKPKPTDALSRYLVALDAPPPPTAARLERREYYFRVPADAPERLAYYRDNLLPDIISDCRDQVRADWLGWTPSHLVTLVSTNPELILLNAQVLHVQQCLLLYTKDANKKMRRQAQQIAKDLNGCDIKAALVPFRNNERMAVTMWRRVQGFCRGLDPDQLVFDTTPGSKLMTLALEQLARRFYPGSWLLYLWHTITANRVDPFTERPARWRASDPCGPFDELPSEAR